MKTIILEEKRALYIHQKTRKIGIGEIIYFHGLPLLVLEWEWRSYKRSWYMSEGIHESPKWDYWCEYE